MNRGVSKCLLDVKIMLGSEVEKRYQKELRQY